MTTQTMIRPNYRPEIDGLRAVAILPVLLFHLGSPLVSGGFVGVDVFFVISGYLITGIMARELSAGTFDLRVFYRRRILRILPPLLVVILVSTVVAWIVLLPGEIDEFAETALSTILFYSNIHFWQANDYFAPDAKKNVLLHTWSLAVEEQFYIIVPLVLMALRKWLWRFRLAFMIVLVTGSLILSIWALKGYAWATFYLLPTRFWELGLGAVLALAGWPGRIQGLTAHLASIAGLGLIGYAVFTFTPQTPFPAANAMLPVLGAALVILAGIQGLAGKLLVLTPMVLIGRISYSLYLWHWPLIVFYKTLTGPDLSRTEMMVLAVLSTMLAWLSYRFVETPFRRSQASTPRVLRVAAGLIALSAIGVACLPALASALRNFPSEVAYLMTWRDYKKTDAFRTQFRADRCFVRGAEFGGLEVFDHMACLEASRGKSRVLLVGDSHAAHLWQALEEETPDIAVLQATAVGCRPVPNGPGSPHCTALMDYIFGSWLETAQLDGVILSGRWFATDIPALSKAVNRIRNAGIDNVTVLGPTIEYHDDLPVLLARSSLTDTDQSSLFLDLEPRKLEGPIQKAVEAAGGRYISLFKILCEGNDCLRWAGNSPLQFDYGHYTPAGAKLVVHELIRGKLVSGPIN